MKANIRLWVLTGDKQETAVEIAKSCQLIQKNMKVEYLTQKFDGSERNEEIVETLRATFEKFKLDYNCERNDRENGYKNVESNDDLSIVIDGPTLELILGYQELEEEFFSCALYARSVVC